MRKTILTLIFALATMTFCNAQKIEMEKVSGGYQYTQDGNNISLSELSKTLKSNNESFELINKAKIKGIFSTILGGIGGGLIGYQVGTSIGGGDPNWTFVGIGAGFIAVGIPIVISADKNIRHAVELYNSSLNLTSVNNFKPEFKVVANGNGIGLSMNF